MNKPEVTKCPMCGTECLVEGKTTLHYKPARETKIQRLKEQVERLRELAINVILFGTAAIVMMIAIAVFWGLIISTPLGM